MIKKENVIGTIGDTDFIAHGGGVVIKDINTYDETPYMEYIEPPPEDSDIDETWAVYQKWTVYCCHLDRCELLEINGETHLIPYGFSSDKKLPYPVENYIEYKNEDLEKIASYVGITIDELKAAFCSENPMNRADAYEAYGMYHGFENFDLSPLLFSEKEINERYQDLD